MGMVGGGRGAFIGRVHRMAAALDGRIELVAGAFSSDPEKSRLSGADLFLDPARVYGDFREMAGKEAARGDRVDFVTIVVQNHLHFEVAKTFLEAGFHVVCDKPMTHSLDQALELRGIVRRSGLVFALTHNYTGYPMVKEARRMVRDGELGRILKVVAEYPQGYAVGDIEGGAPGQISNWRTDPAIAGISNCMGDIGTHAHNLVRYVTGLEIDELCADLTAFVPGRTLDDDGNCLVRFHGGAKGIIHASQISNGDENALAIRVYGTQASIEWHQEEPNDLIVKSANAPRSSGPKPERTHAPPSPTRRGSSRPLQTSTSASPKRSPTGLTASPRPRTVTISPASKTESPAWPSSPPRSKAPPQPKNG